MSGARTASGALEREGPTVRLRESERTDVVRREVPRCDTAPSGGRDEEGPVDDEAMTSQIAAHDAYLRALDRLHDVEDGDDQRLRRRIAHEVEEARRRWYRLVGDTERADPPSTG